MPHRVVVFMMGQTCTCGRHVLSCRVDDQTITQPPSATALACNDLASRQNARTGAC